MSTVIVTKIIAHAKRISGLTAAEYDYALMMGESPGIEMAIGEAVRAKGLWNDIGEGLDLNRSLWAEAREALAPMREAARAKSYTGWSNASRGPIRYAEQADA